MVALVEEFKHRYPARIIIFDLPPLLHTADVLAFCPYTDALLLVVEEGKTTADEVQRALSLVKNSRPVSHVGPLPQGCVASRAESAARPRSRQASVESQSDS